MRHSPTGASSEIQVYRSEDDEFYKELRAFQENPEGHRICHMPHVVKASSGDSYALSFAAIWIRDTQGDRAVPGYPLVGDKQRP